MKRRILTEKNKNILYKKLRAYLVEILEDEENFNSFEDLYQDAYRVKVYGRNIEDTFEWKHGDGFYSATFLTCDGAWIEVRVKTSYFEYWYSHFVEGRKLVQVEGRLCTEVSRGTGTVRNYIAIG